MNEKQLKAKIRLELASVAFRARIQAESDNERGESHCATMYDTLRLVFSWIAPSELNTISDTWYNHPGYKSK